jgi:hypothetical protein
VSSPARGAAVGPGTITVRGTATDAGGGVVSNVEVSFDGGKRWHPARGRESWSYEWKAEAGNPAPVIMSRAVDDSGNLERPGVGVAVRMP